MSPSAWNTDGSETSDLDHVADRLLAILSDYTLDDLKASLEAERFLSTVTRAFEAPGQTVRHLSLCDRLLRAGFAHPIVVSAQAQALLDCDRPGYNGARAAKAVLEAHSFAPGEFRDIWLSLYQTRMGRMHKDLFDHAVTLNKAGAAIEGQAALDAYRLARQSARRADLSPHAPSDLRYIRRMAEINVISLTRRLLADGIAVSGREDATADEVLAETEQAAADLAEWVQSGLRDTTPEKQDAWDHATLIELECWRKGGPRKDAIDGHLAGLKEAAGSVSSVNNAPFIYRSLWRQLNRIVSGSDPALSQIRTLLAALAFNAAGATLPMQRNSLNALSKVTADELQGMAGGGEYHLMERIVFLADAARTVCAMRTPRAGTVGTGFLVYLADLLPAEYRTRVGETQVILTASHVCYWGDDAPWDYPGGHSHFPNGMTALFEFSETRARVDLIPIWTRASEDRDWLDVSILLPRFQDGLRLPVARPLDYIGARHADGDAFVTGFASGRDMVAALQNTRIVETGSDTLVSYKTRTDRGHSGSPVFVQGAQGMYVHALHFKGSNTLNTGVRIAALRSAIAAQASSIIARVSPHLQH